LLGKKALEASEEVKSDENHMGRAFIYGGETTVKVTGTGVGGRNMEMALASSLYMENMDNAAIFSLGSDGTDGPTDAAGGYVDSDTVKKLGRESIESALKNNDSYNELKKVGGLIITGPTNTNLNDVYVVLLKN
ncbi:MAG: glycerate kinase, partial [Lachnospiraceae bacterium]|nr:glycerate kinase [Lachnospiraceae bacterium]